MRLASVTAMAFAGALTMAHLSAQQPAAGGGRMGGMNMQDAAHKVPNGGIRGSGWQGRPDPGTGRRPAASEAAHKATKGEAVSQTIAMSVKGDTVECSVNGATVASLKKADLVGDGKLKSLDGFAGIRVAHNVDVDVKDFKVT